MSKTLCTITVNLICTVLIAQTDLQIRLENHVCNIDGNTFHLDQIKQNEQLPESDELFKYLSELNFLFEQPYAKYTISKNNEQKIAAAHIQLIGEDIARVISINKDYYLSRLSKASNRKPLFIWILAHELTHHINGDLHYDINGIIANNFKKELLADERAGFAVGMITNVDIDFFEEELKRILSNNPQSATHPLVKYRIIAAKAGWLKAKLKDKDWLNSCSKIYIRKLVNGQEVLGRYNNDNFNGITVVNYQNKEMYFGNCRDGLKSGYGIYFSNDSKGLSSIYLGQWVNDKRSGEGIVLYTNGDWYKGIWKDDKKNGSGTMCWHAGSWYSGTWKDDNMEGQGTFIWSNGDKYDGTWKNNERNGYGTYFWSTGIKFRGYWENDKKNGDGLLYRDNTTIKAGCWNGDKYIGTECK